MTIDVVTIGDLNNPQELRDWYTNHPNANVQRILNVSGIFYVFYTE
jgi:hypothetical protein